ncbi:MAG: hypothetical protein ACREBH_02680 [Candidatus Micrarchaeaceae archaeon]
MMKKQQSMYASFYAEAALKSDMAALRKILDSIGYLKKLEDAQSLRYEVHDGENDGCSRILEFSGDHISLQFYFEVQNQETYRKNMLTFLSAIALVDGVYDIRLGSIYHYFIEAIDQEWHNAAKTSGSAIDGLKDRINVLGDSNCMLSHHIIRLSQRNMEVSASLSIYKEFSLSVIEKAKVIREGKPDDYPALRQLGIGQDDIKRIESAM